MVYRFSPFTFDAEKGELRKDDRPVKLHPQPARVLGLLLSRAGEVVGREEIQNLLWKDETHVDFDLGINSCIRQIRTALEDDAENPTFLKTVPRQGYAFVVSVETDTVARRGDDRRLRLIAGLVVLGLGLAAVMAWMGRPEPQEPLRSTPWTSLEGFELDPAFSPDGDQLAFVWDGGGNGSFHLYVKLVSGGDALQLTNSPANDRYPVWSPDGREIAFTRRMESGYEVRTVPALGGAERRLAESTAIPNGLDWSPDGRFIAMTDQESGESQTRIVFLNTSNGRKTVVTTPPSVGEGDEFPAFSPDGKSIAFIRRDVNAAFSKIAIQALGVQAQPRLVDLAVGQSIHLDWLPDGSALFVAAVSGGYTGLWKVPMNGDKPSRLAIGEGVRTLAIDHAGSRLAYAEAPSPITNIWRITITDGGALGEPSKLITSTRFDWDPEVSPDGKKIAFASWRSGPSGLWVCDGDGTNCRELIAPRAFNPTWSPDGDRIAYTGS